MEQLILVLGFAGQNLYQLPLKFERNDLTMEKNQIFHRKLPAILKMLGLKELFLADDTGFRNIKSNLQLN